MGSSKKHKEKDREREDKKSRSKKNGESSKRRKHRSRSRSKSPSPPGVGGGDFHHRSRSPSPNTSRNSRKRQKEKRRHSGSDDWKDSDVPVAKNSRYVPAPVSRSPSPPKTSGDSSSLSIDETNKLRAKLGLKPLQIDTPASRAPPPQKPRHDDIEEGEEVDFDEETLMRIRDEREKEGETFWKEKQEFVHAPAENITKKREAEKLREKLALRKEKRRLETKLAVSKGLADSDSDDDASAWVRKQKEAVQQKLLAEKKAKELDELDNEFGVGELVASEFVKQKNKAYTDKDLKGIKVLHGQDRITEGDTVILTLQDKEVLNEEDDVLVNPNMVDDEKYEKNIENRKLRPEYNGYNVFDEIEFDGEGNLKGKGVLGKYDEEIDGKKPKNSFVIGEDMSDEARRAKIREKMLRADKILETVEPSSSGLKLASDFYTEEEMVQFKKPKKKVRKVRKALRADDLLIMDAQSKPTPDGVINQKDLGSRKSKKKTDMHSDLELKSESVDMEIDLEIDDMPPPPEIDVSDIKLEDEGDLDFQVALHKARLLKQKEKIKKPRGINVDALLGRDEDHADPSGSGSIVLHATAEFCRTLGDIPRVEGADIYGDEEMDFEREDKRGQIEERGTWNEVEIDETPVDITRPADSEESTILEQEPDVATGIAGALKVAMNKGYLDKEQKNRGGPSKMRHLQAQHYSIEDKSYEDDRFGKRDDRFLSGPIMDFSEKQHYKPDFKLEYTDDDGKPISAKEAFRILSHKFHGKGSGKNKVDKKRRKIDQEKLLQHMNSTDTPLNTLELLQQKQKETHSAYVVLSGNKAGASSLSKSKH